ncbi:hypothetical protein SUBVAR_06498 [Subdoligranulum variabile DSM 15176]|uniref:Uncharacterized protein n=1 Tax=Subdoligranulum variabile DSM 15176 TaxID=411471 RepID=D1PQ30_9FIRM|nr:hypothetical protein SUBVAR_06498 [Subdoligranulum variabile DSM 15176]
MQCALCTKSFLNQQLYYTICACHREYLDSAFYISICRISIIFIEVQTHYGI